MKRNLIKLAALAMAAVMSVGMLAACGSGAESDTAGEVQQEEQSAADKPTDTADSGVQESEAETSGDITEAAE